MNARRTPARILAPHAADQSPDLFRHFRPSRCMWARPPTPEQSISGAMPRNYGLGLDQNESFRPVSPDLPKHQPEQPIGSMQFGARLLSLIHRELLPKSDGL